MFEHLKKLDPSGKTSWCKMPELGHKDAAVELALADDSNSDFWNLFLALNSDRITGRRAKKVTADMSHSTRDNDRKAFVYVVKGWRCVPEDGSGEQFVEFSPDLVPQLIAALPDNLFDILREHARDYTNYDGQLPDAGDLAGN